MEEIGLLKGELPLGKQASYSSQHDPGLLCAIAREQGRKFIVNGTLPFTGSDFWTAYEISWLDIKGKPVIACGVFEIPCETPALVESKSFKLYLNSLNQTRFESINEVEAALQENLSHCVEGNVKVQLFGVEVAASSLISERSWPGLCLDNLDVEVNCYQVEPSLLEVIEDEVVDEALYTHLFRSCCPVTGQPDWASILITYSGKKIDHASLLRYLCSYRLHQGFHEQCVEQIFMDLLPQCECLTIEARFLRRGGLEINPFRTNCDAKPFGYRLLRQ